MIAAPIEYGSCNVGRSTRIYTVTDSGGETGIDTSARPRYDGTSQASFLDTNVVREAIKP